MKPRTYKVAAHRDWDGVVSALLLFPYEKPVLVIDYYELPAAAERLERPARFVEVHEPRYVEHGDVVADHHFPKLESASSVKPLTAYIATREGLLALSGNEGKDISMVRGVYSLLNKPRYYSEEGRRLLRNAIEPPEWLVHVSDVLDNPGLAETREELEAVAGHALWKATGVLSNIAKLRPENLLADLRRKYSEMRTVGRLVLWSRDVQEALQRVRDGVLVLAPSEREAYKAFLVALLAQKEKGVKKIAYGYKTSDGRYRLTFISLVDNWGYEVARRLGGGGRPLPSGGSVGGATVEKLPNMPVVVIGGEAAAVVSEA